MFALLDRAGWPVEPSVIPRGTSDEDAIERVLRSRHRALLVPYHGHRSVDGRRLDGLHFLRKLMMRSWRDHSSWRVVMPVTQFARASITLAALPNDPVTLRVREAVCFVDVSRLVDPGLVRRLREHLEGPQPPVLSAP